MIDDQDTEARTISDADAKAIARALMTEATKEVIEATGRGVWSTIKALLFPLLIALVVWWLSTQGKAIEVPVHLTAKG